MKRYALLFILFTIFTGEISAQSNLYKLHSLFIYNFTKHIQWQQTSGAFTIGVYGSDIAYQVLKENLGAKRVWNQPINLVKLEDGSSISNCQLVYAPKSNKAKIISLIETANKTNTLIVTEEEMFEFGAQICFYLKENRLNFKISKSKCEAHGLKVSSALLTLGTQVD